jgi:hypothetical protein
MPSQPLHFPSERETILVSIVKSRHHLWQLQCDLHETASRSRETISQSLELIAKVDEALARTSSRCVDAHQATSSTFKDVKVG